MIEVRKLALEGVLEIRMQRHEDERGFVSETYNAADFARAGIGQSFIQDNQSYSAARGTLRGLHYQLPPAAQAKLIRVTRGAVFDVAVNIRRGSPAFGRWVGIELSAKAWNQIYIPAGFAHGFVTLEDHTEVIYKVSAPYASEHERSVRFDDPHLGIDWPLAAADVRLSQKDSSAPYLAEAEVFD
jgi:dTDP-4-dehydrorhamnose 3,5-epimerase